MRNSGDSLATQKPLLVRWTSLRGIASILIFLVLAVLVEYVIILYAQGLGLTENPDNRIFGLISPLFHLVPAAVVITLAFSWAYLTRHIATKPQERKVTAATKGKSKTSPFSRFKTKIFGAKAFVSLQQKMANATIKGAITVLLLFAAFAITISLLAYPRIIYETFATAYRNNTALSNFVKGTTEALAPIFGILSAVGNALALLAPAFRGFASALGTITGPLVGLDAAGKYLAIQNAAAWISALLALIYVEIVRKGRRYRTVRKG